jgi:hypothetical protein
MKKYLLPLLAVLTVPAFAADIELDNLSKKQVEDVTTEFAVNFSHTAVAAPETDGNWGVEVGLVAGQTGTPELKKTIEASGSSGSDFKSVYHAGLMARAHFPFDLFAELTVLPEREISDVTVSSKTLGLGWNFGGFFGWGLDVALGLNASSSAVDFKQNISGADSKVSVDSQTRVAYIGVSKVFPIVTPYLKFGAAKQESDLKATTQIFTYTGDEKDTATKSGSYLAAGANLQLAFFKLGFEWSQTLDVKRVSGKLSLDF